MKITRAYGCVLLTSLFSLTLNALAACPDPPRNIQYSDNFYKAQLRYVANSKGLGTNISMPVQDIPIRGAFNLHENTMDISNVTSEQAITYISRELSNNQAQIMAECAAVLCSLQESYPTIAQIKAIDAISGICNAALSGGAQNFENNRDFEIIPKTSYSFFEAGQASNNRVVLSVINHTAGQLILELNDQGLPADFLANSGLQYAGAATQFTVEPFGATLLPFYVRPPAGSSHHVEVVSSVNHNIKSSAEVMAVSEDFGQGPVSIECGEIMTNASIRCTAPNHPDFEANHIGQTFPVPPNAGLDVGPNKGYADNSKCWAETRVFCSPGNFTTKAGSQKMDIEQKVGGQCGAGPSGGGGVLSPFSNWKIKIDLPLGVRGTSWKVQLRAISSANDEVAGVPVADGLRPCHIYITGNGRNDDVSFPRRMLEPQNFEISGLQPGKYQLELRCPGIQSGCFGAPGRLEKHGVINQTIDINIRRIDPAAHL